MAWSWSHTHEAYRNAERNLGLLSLDELRVIWAEWDGNDHEGEVARFGRGLRKANQLTVEELRELIWRRASEAARCDNGGWNAWMCPFGCHKVSFDAPPTLEVIYGSKGTGPR